MSKKLSHFQNIIQINEKSSYSSTDKKKYNQLKKLSIKYNKFNQKGEGEIFQETYGGVAKGEEGKA